MSDNINSQRFIQEVDLLEVCEQFDTPVYVYNAEKIIEQIQKLRNAFTRYPVKLKYAAKALTNQAILKLVRKQEIGLDVVSVQEALLGLRAGFKPHEIMYTPNSVSFAEVQEAVALGVHINIDSLPLLKAFGQAYGRTVPCCIRLNPDIMAGGNTKISVGHNRSKFGIPVLHLEDILQTVSAYNINVDGLHVHTGSDIVDVDVFLLGAEVLFKAAHNFPDLQFIDFGSGFKVPYKPGDGATDLEQLANRLQDAFDAFCQEYERSLDIWFEPGKFIVSEAGSLLARVNVVKQTPEVTFAGLDTGLNHLIRPMMYDAYHQIVNLSNPSGVKKVYNVVGYICETDTFGSNRKIPEIREGDILAIHNAGAYSISMASNYNSRFRPAEVLIHEGKAKLIRKRETLQDLLQNQVDIDI